MIFSNFTDFIAMGGYAVYVWPAYGVTLLVFGINLTSVLYEKNRIKKYIHNYLNSYES